MRKTSLVRQIASALILGIGTVVLLLLIFNLVMLGAYRGRVLPGVSLNGVSLSGMGSTEAAGEIAASYSFPQTGHILLTDGEKKWMVAPVQLGVWLDAEASAQNAMLVGRSGSLFARLTQTLAAALFGYSASPTFHFDQNVAVSYLSGLATQIDQPMLDAGLRIENAQVVITAGQPGRALDISASLGAISTQIQKMQDGIVPLVIKEQQPKVLDVSQQGERVKEILSQPLVLSLPAGQLQPAGPWTLQPADLAKMLMFNEVEQGQTTSIQVAVNPPVLAGYLKSIESQIDLDPANARFIFNDDTRQLDLYQHAVIGRTLDIDSTVKAVDEGLLAGNHAVDLQLTLTQPQVDDTATAAGLGITELIEQQTTYFRGSSSDRVQNIQVASERFKGLLIAPGQVVSMSDILGDISLDNGYAEAPIILDDQTIQGVGGGVCQVSTTLFRTALYAGFPIVERHPHTYRVKYYEQTASGHNDALAGMDATVFVPLVDFKFTNDTPYWLLMETYVSTTNYSLTWKFYSTSDGRQVNLTTPVITDVVDPPDPVYRENPDLPSGVKKQVEYAAAGATVSFNRVVTLNGEMIANDHFVTHYVPWGEVWEYGPGTSGIPMPPPSP